MFLTVRSSKWQNRGHDDWSLLILSHIANKVFATTIVIHNQDFARFPMFDWIFWAVKKLNSAKTKKAHFRRYALSDGYKSQGYFLYCFLIAVDLKFEIESKYQVKHGTRHSDTTWTNRFLELLQNLQKTIQKKKQLFNLTLISPCFGTRTELWRLCWLQK